MDDHKHDQEPGLPPNLIRQWWVITSILYVLVFLILTFPLILISFYAESGETLDGISKVFKSIFMGKELDLSIIYWGYFITYAVVVSAFLFIPMRMAQSCKPITKRSWMILAASAGFLLGLITLGLTNTLYEICDYKLTNDPFYITITLAVCAWIFWFMLFYGYTKRLNAIEALNKIIDRILKGSILELLVAIPSHVIARNRGECCGGYLTFTGLATGLPILFLAFGPGILFLFIHRIKKKKCLLHTEPDIPQITYFPPEMSLRSTSMRDVLIMMTSGCVMLVLAKALKPESGLLKDYIQTREFAPFYLFRIAAVVLFTASAFFTIRQMNMSRKPSYYLTLILLFIVISIALTVYFSFNWHLLASGLSIDS